MIKTVPAVYTAQQPSSSVSFSGVLDSGPCGPPCMYCSLSKAFSISLSNVSEPTTLLVIARAAKKHL